ncbi:MAG: class I SAM-dependent methyltransferase [Rhodospirillales bacterium]|nr:class I SAM-dependent methyltransferase [Rhodospirillales bacterium]
MSLLTHQEAKAFYDRFGARQDAQGWYEDRATSDLIAHGELDRARSVFEFGCGTGRFAERLLRVHLPADCTYWGVDISETMAELARERLDPWAGPARVGLSAGSMRLDAEDHSFDRIISNYVVDLLSTRDIRDLLAEARRVLAPDGLLCLTGLGPGTTAVSKIIATLWTRLHAWKPAVVGGCRPVDVARILMETQWTARYHNTVVSFGIPSVVLVASPAPAEIPA